MKNLFFIVVSFFSVVSFASDTRKFGAPVEEGTGEVVEGRVTEVCQKKGCFMKVKNTEGERFVRFKDYGFFVPKDIVGKNVKMRAITVTEELSVAEQKHLLKDAKAPQEKIDAVRVPLRRDEWLASGVEILE